MVSLGHDKLTYFDESVHIYLKLSKNVYDAIYMRRIKTKNKSNDINDFINIFNHVYVAIHILLMFAFFI